MSNQVYISQDANEVNLVNTDKQLVITEVGNGTSVNVTQPITSVITVASIGPQGQVGPAGPEGPSGSLQPDSSGSFGITGSLTLSGSNPLTVIGPVVFTGSLNVTQGITGSLLGTATNALTASYTTNISGGSTGYVPLWKSNSTLGTSSIHQDDGNVGIGTLLPEAKLHVKGPGSTDLYTSFIVQNSNGNPSFVVLGSGHVGIENLAPAYELDVTGTGRFTNGLLVTGSLRAPSITGSVQGTASNAVSSSYALTASYAANVPTTASYALSASVAVSSSYALSASYLIGQSPTSSYALTASYLNPLNQDVSLTGNLTINGTASINYLNVSYESASIIYSSGSNQFGDAANDTQTLYGTVIIPTGSLTVTGSQAISGSLTANNGNLIVNSGSIFVNTSNTIKALGYTLAPFYVGVTNGKNIGFTYTSAATIISLDDGNTAVQPLQFRASSFNFTDTSGLRISNTGYGSTPSAMLHVVGSGTTSSTTSLLVQDGGGGQLLKLQDDGKLITSVIQNTSDTFRNSFNEASLTIGNRMSMISNTGIDFQWQNFVQGNFAFTATANTNNSIASTKNSFYVAHTFNDGAASTLNSFRSMAILDSINMTTYPLTTYTGLYISPTVSSSATTVRAIHTTTGSVIFDGGSVGIGTTSPAYKLDISGSGRFTNGLTVTSSLTVLGSTSISGSVVNSGSYRFYSEQDSAFVATVSGSRSSSDIAFNFRKIGEPTAGSRHTMIVEGTGGQDTNLYFGVNAVGSNPGAIFAVKGNGSVNINMPNPTSNYGGLAVGGWISSYPSLLVRGVGSTSSTTSLRVENSSTTTSLVVLDNGNVGIGTTSPAYTLDVNGIGRVGASGGSGQFYIKGFAGAGQYLYLDDGAKSWSLVGGTNYAIQEDGNSRLTIKEGGNVGIGTANPTAKLFVAGTSGKVIAVSGSDSDDGLFLDERLFIAFGDAGTTSARFRGLAASFAFQDASFNTYGQIGIAGSNTYFDSGNVGVGTTAPAAKLQVKGSGATSSTTALSIQNSDNSYNFSIRDDGNLTTNSNFVTINSYDTTIGGANKVAINGTNFGTGYIYRGVSTGFLTLGNDSTVSTGITLYGSTHSTLPDIIRVTQSGSIVMTIASGSVGIGTSGSSAKLAVYKSGSTVVDIQGSQGQLFSIVDALSGSLMSVNDISGLPILEVFSDDRVVMGTYGNAGLIVTGSDVQISASLFGTRQTGSLAVGSTLLYTINTGSYTAGFFDYFVNSGSNYRAGNIMAVFGAGTYKFTDLATPDIGSTTNLQFSMSMAGASAQLYASASSAGWTVKTTFRTI